MALYPNTPFAEGQIVTPDLLYTAFNPVFDDNTQYLGHLVRLTDDSLSNAAGNVKSRLASVTDNFKVSAGSGLTISYRGGGLINNNDLVTIAPGTLGVPANASFYVFLNKNSVVQIAPALPVVRSLLAYCVTSDTTVTVFDLRTQGGIPTLLPNISAIAVFGGQGEDGEYNAINGDVLDKGEYNFSRLTVAAGVSISVKAYARIRVSGDCTIAGTINITPATAGASPVSILQAAGTSFGGGSGYGVGGGAGELPSATYSYLISPVGSGGGGGYNYLTGTVPRVLATTQGGAGGGGLQLDCAGVITVESTGIIRASGGNGTNSVRLFPFHGSGGAGGGSGGLIALRSPIRIRVTGTLEARGGNGGNGDLAGDSNQGGEAGSGGGGGTIALISPVINRVGATINLSGGAGGARGSASANNVGIGGAGGSFGGLGGTQTGDGVGGGDGLLTEKTILPSA